MGAMANFWLEPWDERGPALERRANTPEMQAFLGGVESEESILARHRRILDTVHKQEGAMLFIMVEDEPDPVGSVGYWDAYPKVDNAASNAICRKAGFELRGEVDFEYPKGHPIRCHDWRFDLAAVGGPS